MVIRFRKLRCKKLIGILTRKEIYECLLSAKQTLAYSKFVRHINDGGLLCSYTRAKYIGSLGYWSTKENDFSITSAIKSNELDVSDALKVVLVI